MKLISYMDMQFPKDCIVLKGYWTMYDASSGCRWRISPPDVEGSCKCIE
jgi:hypothetical protein